MNKEVDQINQLAEELEIDGIQIHGPEDVDVEPGGGDAEAISVTLFKNHEIGEHETHVGDITRNLIRDGVDWQITIKHRIKCPSCETVAREDGDRLFLAGQCRLCGNKVCDQCRTTCTACGKVMCDNCSSGHGLEQETLCHEHREDIEQSIQFERNLEAEKQSFKQKMEVMQESRQRRKDKVQKKLNVLRILKDLERQRQQNNSESSEWSSNPRFQAIEQSANQFQNNRK